MLDTYHCRVHQSDNNQTYKPREKGRGKRMVDRPVIGANLTT